MLIIENFGVAIKEKLIAFTNTSLKKYGKEVKAFIYVVNPTVVHGLRSLPVSTFCNTHHIFIYISDISNFQIVNNYTRDVSFDKLLSNERSEYNLMPSFVTSVEISANANN